MNLFVFVMYSLWKIFAGIADMEGINPIKAQWRQMVTFRSVHCYPSL